MKENGAAAQRRAVLAGDGARMRPPAKVVTAARLLRKWVISDMGRAAMSPEDPVNFYLFERPGRLADELKHFLDVFDPPAPRRGSK